MIKAVIFDLDGTLFDEKDFVKSGFRAVSVYLAAKYRINEDIIYDYLMREFDLGLRRKNFDALVKNFSLTEETVSDLVKVYRMHRPNVRLYSDAEALLSHLRDEQYRLGLITDGNAITQRKKIQALGLANSFDEIIITEELGEGCQKPSDVAYKLMIRKLNVRPEECVYVGDNPVKDFIPAKKLGITTIRVRRGNGFHDLMDVPKELDADYQVTDLLALPALISQINKRKK